MVGAIIFDCDGVLVDSEILAVEVETGMLADCGLEYDVAEFKTRFMGMSDDAFYADLDADSLARLGRPLPVNFRADCTARLYKAVEERLLEVDGARLALAGLRHRKAVASSSTSEKLAIKLRKAGLWELFAPHIYSADHVARAKPAPDLFLYAAAALDVNPSECLVLEDSVNGIRAARAAGMRVWGFAGGGHMDQGACTRLNEAGAERVVFTWAEAATLLADV
jgi:HAD superfamily hydrolase (TIGR01509 family)